MSKYGPAWVWPSTGQSFGQVLPLPAQLERRGVRRQAPPPHTQAIRGLSRGSTPGTGHGGLGLGKRSEAEGLRDCPDQGPVPKRSAETLEQPRPPGVRMSGEGSRGGHHANTQVLPAPKGEPPVGRAAEAREERLTQDTQFLRGPEAGWAGCGRDTGQVWPSARTPSHALHFADRALSAHLWSNLNPSRATQHVSLPSSRCALRCLASSPSPHPLSAIL